MADIIQFTSREDLSKEENIKNFIHLCKDEIIFIGKDCKFEDDIWNLSNSIHLNGRNVTPRAIFSSLEAVNNKKNTPSMHDGFKDFAKAYFLYIQATKPSKSFLNRIAFLRYVDAALRDFGDGSCKILNITHDTLNIACGLLIKKYSEEAAAKVAGQMESFAKFLLDNNLCSFKSTWVKPFKKPKSLNIKVGKEADEARETLMPSAAAIEAMAHVFVNAISPVEKYVGATLALLHCAPQRINETVRLAVNCEVECQDINGNHQFGLRWPGSKGFDNQIKWIVPSMTDVAKKAISKIEAASKEAREIALWYEKNPDKIYLKQDLVHLRNKDRISIEAVSEILFGDRDIKNARAWCLREKLERDNNEVSFKDFQRAVLKKLPPQFPYAQPGLLYSKSLFIARRFEFDIKLRTYHCLIDYITSDQIASRIGHSGSAVGNVFERFELKEDDGSAINLTTHQVRHYLNTLAQANGASQLDIAMWSGRADIQHNKAYDHVTPDQIMKKTRELAIPDNNLFGGDLNTPKIRILARRDQEGQLITGAAHITDYGMCVHDYAMSPCQIHLDCLNCNELICIKGDHVKAENIRRLKVKTQELLINASKAEEEGVYGASRWLLHQRRTLEHCTKLLDTLEDPKLENGSIVQLVGIHPASRIEKAANERNSVVDQLSAKKNPLLERVKKLRGENNA